MRHSRTTLFRLIALGTATAAAFSLSACSSGGGDADTLTVWTRSDGEVYTKQLAEMYEKANPGLTVDVTVLPNSDVQQKLGSAISSGNPPDVVAIDVVKAPYFINAGAFQDLTERIDGLDYADDLLPAQVDAGTFEDKKYTSPFTADTSVLYYNKDLFRQAGLDPEAPPTTWQEFATAADSIGGLGDDITGYHYSAGCGGCAAFALAPMVWASGGDFIDADSGALNPDATFTDPVVSEFIELLNGMVADGGITTASQTDGGENYGGAFENGKLGMVASGSFYLNTLQSSDLPFEMGVTPLPGKNAGEISSMVGGDVLAIPEGAKNGDAAWDFVKWATGDDAQKTLAESGFTPVRTDLYESDYSSKGPEQAALVEAALQGQVPYTVSFNALFSDPNGPMVSLMQAGVFGDDVDAASAAAQKTAEQIVTQNATE